MPQSGTRDLVLTPIEYADILDTTKGNITVWVGPARTSLSETDQPVLFDRRSGRFEHCALSEATHAWPVAAENQYIVLENPAEGRPAEVTPSEGKPTEGRKSGEYPTSKTSSDAVPLSYGRTLNVHGPTSFPLWPGQLAEVIGGHELRSNEYLIVQVTNEDEARQNWEQAVLRPQKEPGDEGDEKVAVEDEAVIPSEPPDLTMGQRFIVPGTQVSFFMPPTGLMVVKDSMDEFVRQAVTLERLEYCILLSEQGSKRYVRGPAVVFPRPDEMFVAQDEEVKFKAVELTSISGIYIKVIADYEEGGEAYTAGKELFITGDEQAIYWPREEHAVIRYGDREIHYAVAVPKGEARYVLNREAGEIDLEKGPAMFLADPITQVIVRRVLSPKEVDLWFPGNEEALDYNRDLALLSRKGPGRDYVEERTLREQFGVSDAEALYAAQSRAELIGGEDFERRTTFTPPRTIVLDTKYQGAVTIEVWPEYAVMVVDKTGNRKVVVGPEVVLLEYDETLTALEMLTGTPKSDERIIRTVYLLTRNNRVKDIVDAETSDLVKVKILLAHRVNFEADSDEDKQKWFAVENYVKLLVEHMRSMIRATVKQVGIEEFYGDPTSIIRDAILGVAEGDVGRPGRFFDENSMRIYDVEVLKVEIGDSAISIRLQEAQHEAVAQALELASKERELDATKRGEKIQQEILDLKDKTALKEHEQAIEIAARGVMMTLAELESELKEADARLEAEQAQQEGLDEISNAARERQRADDLQRIEAKREEVEVQVKAFTEQVVAVPSQLSATLQAFADKELMGRLAEAFGPMALLGGGSVIDLFKRLLGDTALAGNLAGLFAPPTSEDESVDEEPSLESDMEG